jgi:hypothetical protein
MYELLKDDPSVFPEKTLDSFNVFPDAHGKKRRIDLVDMPADLDELTDEGQAVSKKNRSAVSKKAEANEELLNFLKENSKKREEQEAKRNEQEARRLDQVDKLLELLGSVVKKIE